MMSAKLVVAIGTLAVCLVGLTTDRASAQGTAAFTRQSDVIYGRKAGVALTMEVFTPAVRNGLGVVWVVSSGGFSSREQTLQETFAQRISPFLNGRYTVFAVIPGSAPAFNVQDMVSDVKRAIRFIRSRAAEFSIDGSRLGLSGSSAGGFLALSAGMKGDDGGPSAPDAVDRESSAVQALGCFFPPTDLLNYGAPSQSIVDFVLKQNGSVDPSFQFYTSDPKTGARSPVSAPDEIRRLLRELSPIAHVAADGPPTLLIHGDRDRAVPIEQSEALVARLRGAGVPARLVVREGVGHAYQGWEADAQLIVDWFDERLGRAR